MFSPSIYKRLQSNPNRDPKTDSNAFSVQPTSSLELENGQEIELCQEYKKNKFEDNKKIKIKYEKIHFEIKRTSKHNLNCLLHSTTGKENHKGEIENSKAHELREDILTLLDLFEYFEEMPSWLGCFFHSHVSSSRKYGDYFELTLAEKKEFYKKFRNEFKSGFLPTSLLPLFSVLSEQDIFYSCEESSGTVWCRKAYDNNQNCSCHICAFNSRKGDSWTRALQMNIATYRYDPKINEAIKKLFQANEEKLKKMGRRVSLSPGWIENKKESGIFVIHQKNHASRVQSNLPKDFKDIYFLAEEYRDGRTEFEPLPNNDFLNENNKNVNKTAEDLRSENENDVFTQAEQNHNLDIGFNNLIGLIRKVLLFFGLISITAPSPEKNTSLSPQKNIIKKTPKPISKLQPEKPLKITKLLEGDRVHKIILLQSLDRKWFEINFLNKSYSFKQKEISNLLEYLKNLVTELTNYIPPAKFSSVLFNHYNDILSSLKLIICEINHPQFSKNNFEQITRLVNEINTKLSKKMPGNKEICRDNVSKPEFILLYWLEFHAKFTQLNWSADLNDPEPTYHPSSPRLC